MFWKEISVDTCQIVGKAVYWFAQSPSPILAVLEWYTESHWCTMRQVQVVLWDFVTTTHYYCKIEQYNQ